MNLLAAADSELRNAFNLGRFTSPMVFQPLEFERSGASKYTANPSLTHSGTSAKR